MRRGEKPHAAARRLQQRSDLLFPSDFVRHQHLRRHRPQKQHHRQRLVRAREDIQPPPLSLRDAAGKQLAALVRDADMHFLRVGEP